MQCIISEAGSPHPLHGQPLRPPPPTARMPPPLPRNGSEAPATRLLVEARCRLRRRVVAPGVGHVGGVGGGRLAAGQRVVRGGVAGGGAAVDLPQMGGGGGSCGGGEAASAGALPQPPWSGMRAAACLTWRASRSASAREAQAAPGRSGEPAGCSAPLPSRRSSIVDRSDDSLAASGGARALDRRSAHAAPISNARSGLFVQACNRPPTSFFASQNLNDAPLSCALFCLRFSVARDPSQRNRSAPERKQARTGVGDSGNTRCRGGAGARHGWTLPAWAVAPPDATECCAPPADCCRCRYHHHPSHPAAMGAPEHRTTQLETPEVGCCCCNRRGYWPAPAPHSLLTAPLYPHRRPRAGEGGHGAPAPGPAPAGGAGAPPGGAVGRTGGGCVMAAPSCASFAASPPPPPSPLPLPPPVPWLSAGRSLAGVQHGGARGAGRLRRRRPPLPAEHPGGGPAACSAACSAAYRDLPPRSMRCMHACAACKRSRTHSSPPPSFVCPPQVQAALAGRQSPEWREADEKLREARAAAQGACH